MFGLYLYFYSICFQLSERGPPTNRQTPDRRGSSRMTTDTGAKYRWITEKHVNIITTSACFGTFISAHIHSGFWPPCQEITPQHVCAHSTNSPCPAPAADKVQRHTFQSLSSFHFLIQFYTYNEMCQTYDEIIDVLTWTIKRNVLLFIVWLLNRAFPAVNKAPCVSKQHRVWESYSKCQDQVSKCQRLQRGRAK